MKIVEQLLEAEARLNDLSKSYQKRRQERIINAANRISSYKPSIREDGGLYLGYVPFGGSNKVSVNVTSRVRKRGVRYLANSRTSRSLRARLYGMMRLPGDAPTEYHFMTLTVPNHVKYAPQTYEFDRLAGLCREKFIQNLRKNYGLVTFTQASERQDGERKDTGVARHAIHWHIVTEFEESPNYKRLSFVWLATLARHGFTFLSDVTRKEMYAKPYAEQIAEAVRLFQGRQYKRLMENGLDFVKHKYDHSLRKNIFLLGCLDMEPVRDTNDFGAISSYLSCYLSKDRSEGTFSYRVSGSRGMKIGKEKMTQIMADFLEKKTGKVLMHEVEDTVYRRPMKEVEVPRYTYKYVNGELIEVVRMVKAERRDTDRGFSVPEKVKRWVFEEGASYHITQLYGDHRVYKGCVKPQPHWKKVADSGTWKYVAEGMKFDYYSWTAWYESWEQDDDFKEVLKKHTGIDLEGRQFHYHQFAGAFAPKKFDNSIRTVWN
jgi:hypothetical protein